MASLGREKVASGLARKRKSSDTAAQIFKDDRGRSERRSEGERSRVGANKRPGRRRSARVTQEGNSQKSQF